MADHVFRSIAAEGKRIPTWDIESILTRAVYRALNNGGGNQLANVEHPNFPANVDKGRMTTDAQLQLRLVAEKLCTRVERRYEKRLLQQREKDRVDTDRKLAEIRAEYAEQVEVRRRELERERKRLEEHFADKDRALRHKVELQLAERESALEITRKSLETRLSELAMNKEHLDRAKADFHAKFTSDMELLNHEWAKIRGKQDELRTFYRQEFEAELEDVTERSAVLEKENAALKKKLGDSNADLYRLRSQLAKMTGLEEDLKVANDRIREEVEERHRLSRCSYEAERLRGENAFLKEELEELKASVREPKHQNTLKTTVKNPTEEVYLSKISELKNVIKMMSEKITSLTSERDYLRGLLRNTRREVPSGSTANGRGLPSGGSFRNSRQRVHLRDTDSSEDTSISSSSACASNLRDIKKRFTTLEDLAKTLDTTIDCVTAARSAHERLSVSSEMVLSDNYDDFCRSLKSNAKKYSSPKKVVEEEAKKKSPIEVENAADFPTNTVTDTQIEKTRRLSSSVTERVSVFPSATLDLKESKESNEETTALRSNESPSMPVDSTNSFVEKLRARNEMKRTLKSYTSPLQMGEPEESNAESSGHAPHVQDNDVMRSYLALLNSRKTEQSQQVAMLPKPYLEDNLPEVEEVVIDKEGGSGDEIDW